MPRFIQTDRVAISDDAGNTVYIRRKMDLGAVSKVQGAAPGEQLVSLYVANILAWQGPDFRGIDCTPETIATIDPNDPFWERVATKIAELNVKEATSPLASMTTGGPSTPVGVVEAAANGAST